MSCNVIFVRDIPPYYLIRDYLQLVVRGIVDKNFKVLSARKLYDFYGKNVTVTKSSKPPTDPTELYIAKYTYNGFGHWVCKRGDQIVFNLLAFSHCVAHGRPVDFRLLSH